MHEGKVSVMTPTERRHVTSLLKAANKMARREPGATDEYRKLLEKRAEGLLGKTGKNLVLGSANRTLVLEDTKKEEAERRAKLCVEIAYLEDYGRKRKRSTTGIEDRAIELLDLSMTGLRKMRRELKKKYAKEIAASEGK